MKMSDNYLNDQLSKAQELLWGGSETENIEAHNIIAKLIKDRVEQVNLQGQAKALTNTIKYRLELLTKLAIVDIINTNEISLKGDNK